MIEDIVADMDKRIEAALKEQRILKRTRAALLDQPMPKDNGHKQPEHDDLVFDDGFVPIAE